MFIIHYTSGVARIMFWGVLRPRILKQQKLFFNMAILGLTEKPTWKRLNEKSICSEYNLIFFKKNLQKHSAHLILLYNYVLIIHPMLLHFAQIN